MAKKITYNIPLLYQKVFGINGVLIAATGAGFAIPNVGTVKSAVKSLEFAAGQAENEALQPAPVVKSYAGVTTIPAPTGPSIQSYMGTPIYEQITLTVPSTIVNGAVTNQGFQYTFPDWPLFDINPAWLIVKENTQGGGPAGGNVQTVGTVKEFVQQDDFQITVRGFLINYDSQDYPEQLMADLWKVLNAQQTLGITSRVFNLLGIHNIVITAARFPGVEGYINMQPFEFDAVSDFPSLLQIKSTKTQNIIVPGL
jgi:hypothetical protein